MNQIEDYIIVKNTIPKHLCESMINECNKKDSEFKLLYFLGSSFIACCIDLENDIGGNVLSCLK